VFASRRSICGQRTSVAALDVAVAHSVVTGREADEPGHADVIGVLPFDMLLAAQRAPWAP
jgi:hypothetical protein